MANASRRTSQRANPRLEAALAYAREGIRVFPLQGIVDDCCTCGVDDCDSAGKHPLTRSGFKDATTDEEQIEKWWKRHPDANVGAVPGPAFVVVDVDPRGGGFASLAEVERVHGDLPSTIVAETGEYEVEGERVRGLHLWFRVQSGALRLFANSPGVVPAYRPQRAGRQ